MSEIDFFGNPKNFVDEDSLHRSTTTLHSLCYLEMSFNYWRARNSLDFTLDSKIFTPVSKI